MTRSGEHTSGESLELRSRISELARIPSWIERLASLHPISENMQFAMNLCLEEVLSNIIKHGYAGDPDRSIAVRFTCPRDDYFVFVVEDQAPPFNAVKSPKLPPLAEISDHQIGGQGIRLLREFADTLEYQATPTGNRLSIGFLPIGSAAAKR